MSQFDLDIIGALNGTDKSSSHSFGWDYLRHYQELFAPFKNQPINVVEIGVQGGASLKTWRAFFTQATIVGIDIDPACQNYKRDRIEIEIGSQADGDFLHAVLTKYPPAIIIDDGSHMAEHIIFTFEKSFPYLVPGGIYVVEDTAFHFGKTAEQMKGNSLVSVPDYFDRIARARLAHGQPGAGFDDQARPGEIDTVTCIGGMLALKKRQPRDLPASLDAFQSQMKQMGSTAFHYAKFLEYILRHDGPLARAEAVANEGLAVWGRDHTILTQLTEVLDRQGRQQDAVAIALEITKLRPNDVRAWHTLARIEGKRGLADNQIAALDQVARLEPKSARIHDHISHVAEAAGNIARAASAARVAVELEPNDERLQQRAYRLRQA